VASAAENYDEAMTPSLRPGRSRRASVVLAGLLAALLGSTAHLSAHDPNAEPVVDMTIRAAAGQLVVSVTLPGSALSDANLPTENDGLLAAQGLEQPLEVVGRGIANTLELRQADVLLPPPAIRAAVGPDRLSALITLVYPFNAANGSLSGRLHTFRSGGTLIRTLVHYEPLSGAARTFDITGDYERVLFEPQASDVVKQFATRGTTTLLGGSLYFLVALCLIAPLRSARTLTTAVVALAGGQLIASAAATLAGWSPGATTLATLQIVEASTVVVLAAQGVLSPRSRWLPALGLVFGLVFGAELGAQFTQTAAFAGAHHAAGFVTFALILILGEAWIAALMASATGLIYRWPRVPERWTTLMLAAIVAHTALHRVSDSSQRLTDAGIPADRLLMTVTLGWAAAILCAGIAGSLLRTTGPANTPTWSDASGSF